MRIVILFLLLVFSALAQAETGEQHAQSAARGLVGTPAPRLVLKTIDGQTIDLASYYGKKAVYLKFWATWCVPCREQMPHLKEVYEHAGSDLAVIAVDVGFDDTVEDVRKYRDAMGLKMPIVFDDGSIGEAFHLRVTPQHVVIGKDGRVLYVGHEVNAKLTAALQAARTSVASSDATVAAPHVSDHDDSEPVTNLSVPTLDGESFQFDAQHAHPTVLVFLSPWCETYLAHSRPALAASCKAVREQVTSLSRDSPVRWLGIASGLWSGKDDLLAYQREHHLTMPLALDASGTLFRRFRVMHVPTLLLIDAQGHVVRRIEGVDAQLPSKLKALAAH
ncbi:TlpA disulfide reductase family protein [Dyella sp.]|uniref:TlpA family protein disulfide reductase n=1 Tax=Dyella sp. TaxID=1869338 RepID=UPI002B488D30|nr:TlpA disulfide reductase family protein [Dyella sp.]HKT27131.1 TlpA disulfide reductase family protein [Dyella sp.]